MGTKDPRIPLARRFIFGASLWLLLAANSASFAADDPAIILDLDDVFDLDEIIATANDNRASDDSLQVLSLNLNQFFDDVDNGNNEKVLSTGRFKRRIDSVAKALGSEHGLADVIALQEVENLNVLQQLADEIRHRYRVGYRLIMIPGQDVSGINIAYMVGLNLQVKEWDQLFADKLLEFDNRPLFSRPPLYLGVCREDKCFSLLNLHLRSMRGINSEKHGQRVAIKRRQQAETIAAWCNQMQRAEPGLSLLLLGDLNALTPSDAHVDVAGIIRGNPDNRRARLPARDLIDPDFIDLTLRIPAAKRYSYIYRQKKQQLDYMLVNQGFAAEVESIEFSRIDKRLSDHAALWAKFTW